jgi:hypothetical protein
VPRVLDLETVTPDSVPEFPGLPRQFAPMPANLLSALAEAARTTARESARFALSRVQLRGKSGDVVATDGRQLLVRGGFAFPWQDSVLVARVPAFGARELADEGDVAVGRTKSHVAVKVGPWTFLLAINTKSRYPDVDGAIPRSAAGASHLRLDPGDAEFLAANLRSLPGGEEYDAPVTLDLHPPVALRGMDPKHGTAELVLSRSTVTGPPLRVCTNRRYLVRAVQLGFREFATFRPGGPLVCWADTGTYLWVPLDPASCVPPAADVRRLPSAEGPPQTTAPEPERREDPMPAPRPNGQPPENGRPKGGTEPERWGISEVIAEAEALRGLLHDASARTARLLAALKHQRRKSRAVHQAVQSLRDLQLDH